MSLSTTTTATYELAKYSRAYNHSAGTQSQQLGLQWQHFVNPVIRLAMDTRKSAEGHLESYRLRIVWTFSAGLDSMDVDQREVVFEDLDLVTYSSMPSLHAPQGLPLKAVYQDAVVGLRYQHPRVTPPGAVPQYRRFQVAFHSAASALAFVETIRFICPCKANAPPPARMPQPISQRRVTQTVAASRDVTPAQPSLRPGMSAMSVDDPLPAVRRTGTTLPSAAQGLPAVPSGLASSQAIHAQSQALASSAYTSAGSTGLIDLEPATYSSSRPSSAASASSAVAQYSSSDPYTVPSVSAHTPAPPNAQPAIQCSTTNAVRPRHIHQVSNVLPHSGSSESSLPSSSFPRSSSPPMPMGRLRPSSPDLMPPPPLPAREPRILVSSPVSAALTVDASNAGGTAPPISASNGELPDAVAASAATPAADILATLRDGDGVYGLSRDDLETLVAEVIREEGFRELMQALDGMWKVKGLVGIH
ncbi:hypothetical protein BV20DRAFT_1044323 [Pilatotrama ljubarskyi]|nr:hypothetical protein BV20DRAFT_1044323 [Pilatotrama ljubarskyi]